MNMPNSWKRYAPPVFFIAVCFFFFAGLTAWMAGVWKFDFFNPGGDVYEYWKESLTWGLPFHPHHPPGYPWLIAILRLLAGAWLAPLRIMQTFSFLFLVGGGLLMVPLCNREGIPRRGWWMAFLFIAWPFVGSLYAIYPQIDSIVLFFLILGILLAVDNRWILAGAAWGAAMLTHPVAWILGPLLLLMPWGIWAWEKRRSPSFAGRMNGRELLVMTGLAAAPMIILWLWQTAVTGDPWWTVASIFKAQVVSRGTLPILDGWVGTVIGKGISGWAKVGILAMVVLVAAAVLVRVWSDRTAPMGARMLFQKIICILIPGVLLGMAVVLNQHEIWAVVRFSKILIVPLILCRDRLFGFIPQRLRTPALCVLIGLGFLTQVVYAWYMANVFFSV
jgi:hypothetical protein